MICHFSLLTRGSLPQVLQPGIIVLTSHVPINILQLHHVIPRPACCSTYFAYYQLELTHVCPSDDRASIFSFSYQSSFRFYGPVFARCSTTTPVFMADQRIVIRLQHSFKLPTRLLQHHFHQCYSLRVVFAGFALGDCAFGQPAVPFPQSLLPLAILIKFSIPAKAKS